LLRAALDNTYTNPFQPKLMAERFSLIIIGMAHVFPTMSEGVKKANQAFYRDVTTMSCCVE